MAHCLTAYHDRNTYGGTILFMMTRKELHDWRITQQMEMSDAAMFVGVKERTWAAWEWGENPVPQMLENLLCTITTIQYLWWVLAHEHSKKDL